MQTRPHNASQQRPAPPSPHRQLSPRSPSTCSIMNGRIRLLPLVVVVVAGGLEEQMAGLGLVMSAFFWGGDGGRTMHLSESLIEGGEGDLSGQTAGRQRVSHPPRPGPSTYTHSAINWHGPWLKYSPGACKQKKDGVWEKKQEK